MPIPRECHEDIRDEEQQSGDHNSPAVMRGVRVRSGLLSRSRRESQENGQNIAIIRPTATIQRRANTHEGVRCESESWPCGAREPKTKRRLSGWLSKIRMRLIVLQPGSAGTGGATMAKIFFRSESVESRSSDSPMRDTRIHFEYF